MFRSLRTQLILSHVIPMLVVMLLIGVGLVYVLETRFLMPSLAEELSSTARLLAEVSRANLQLWGDERLVGLMLSRVQLDPNVHIQYLTPAGILLYSNLPEDEALLGQRLDLPGLQVARAGQDVVVTDYGGLFLNRASVEAFSPVILSGGDVFGVLRLSYPGTATYRLFWQFRFLIGAVVLFALAVGTILGSSVAINISKPIRQVTQAIYALARGDSRQPLVERGPEETRELVRAINYLVALLHDLEQSRRQLLANLVHELGRPLGALRSAIQAFGRGAASDPQLLSDLTQGMDQEAARLERIVDDLAHLYGQVIGTLELMREPIVLGEWLPGLLAPWQQSAQDKHLRWNQDIPPDLPTIQADPARLGQVIGNIVSNAIKYTPPGKSVLVTAGVQGKEVWIRVSDSGPGIYHEEQKLIFEPFYRGEQGRRIKQGMGLGLSIARDITLAHGGKIDVQSNPGEGSIFTIWLPGPS